jgi:hypothetical protein
MWSSRRILTDLADSELRRKILSSFWRHAEANDRLLATAQLAKAIHFREETLRKLPLEKKADLLASRLGDHDFEQFFQIALLLYHTRHQNEMLAAFLDRWNIPHENGSIEGDDYASPSAADVRAAVQELGERFEKRDVMIYLATAGLLMSEAWEEATWPVVDELASA